MHARQQFGWRIERAAVGLYILRNVGWSDATAVGISSDIEVGLQGAVEHLDLAAGQGVSFVGMLGSAPPKAIDVRITWTAPGETEPRVWVEPFPDRPASVAEFDADIRRPFRQ